MLLVFIFGPPQFKLILYLKKANEIKLCEKEHIKQSSTNKFKFIHQQYIQWNILKHS